MKKECQRKGTAPVITVHNRQRIMRISLPTLQQFAICALRECVRIPGIKGTDLEKIAEVGVILVSDRRMADLHRRFLNTSGPTDVITFQHGEMFVSVETARRNARRFGNSVEGELRLYIAHGLLHLHRFDDKNPAGAAEIERVQKKLVMAAIKRGA